MNRKVKASFISLIFLSVAVGVSAQPSPPHEVYGNITDGGEPVEGVTVEAVTGSNTFSSTTSSDGYYSIKVPSNYTSFDMVVDGATEKEDISVQSGSINRDDFSGKYVAELSVTVDDEDVDEGSSIDLSPTVSNEGSGPSYSWSFTGDDYGASFSDKDEKDTTFNAPSDVSEDRDVEVELKVTKEDGSSGTGSAIVTVANIKQKKQQQQEQEEQQEQQEEEEQDQETEENQKDTEQDQNQDLEKRKIAENSSSNKFEAVTENGKAKTVIEKLNADEEVEVTVSDSSSDTGSEVESVRFASNKDLSNVSVEVEDLGKDFNKIRNKTGDKKPEGIVYSYQNIDVSNVEDDSITNASVTFKIRKLFVESNKATVDDVRLNRYNGEEWESYEAEQVGETDTHYRLKSNTQGFSPYSITLDKDSSNNLLIPIISVLLIAGISAAAYKYRDEIEEKMTGMDIGEEESSEGYTPR